VRAAVPEADVAAQAGTGEGLLGDDGQDVADGAAVALLLLVGLVEGVPPGDGALLLEGGRVVDVDDGVGAPRVQYLLVLVLPVGVPDFELDFRDRDDLLEREGGGVPEVDGEVVGGGGDEVLQLEVLQVEDVALVGVHLVLQVRIGAVVDLEPRRLLFDQEEALEFLEEVDVFDAILVFLAVDDLLAGEVRLDDVLEVAVVAGEAQLDDVVAKLFPLHGLVVVDVDLLEEVDEGQRKAVLQFLVFGVVLEVLEHDRQELVHAESFLLFLEALLDQDHLLAVQHLEDLVLGYLDPRLLLLGGRH
jgi:hypothetical protein